VHIPAENTTVDEHGQLTIVTPRRNAGGPVFVRLVRADGQFDVRMNAFTYDDPLPLPTISKVVPASLLVVDQKRQTIAIEGAHFVDGCTVAFDGIEVKAIVESGARLVVEPPPHTVGTVDVRITNPDGGIAVATQAFSYELPPPAPAVAAIRPPKASILGGTVINILGANFHPEAIVAVAGY
jgi:hypothetical protein